jgi:hypothetical protein
MVLKTKAEARSNFEAAIPFIGARYSIGIKKADWFTPASSDEAEKNFSTAMTDVLAKKKRQLGIKATSNAEWQTAADTKGAPIIGDRIRAALGTWEAVWGPMYDRIVSLVPALPKKTLDYKVNIAQRLTRVVEEWKKAAGKL